MLAPDRFMGNYRTTVNIIGYAVATFVIARWEGLLDHNRAKSALDGSLPYTSVENNVLAANKQQINA